MLQDEDDCTIWIRRSTGQLCTDLIEPNNITNLVGFWDDMSGLQGLFSLGTPNAEGAIIDSLTLEQYHRICDWNLRKYRRFPVSASIIVNLGTVVSCPSSNRFEDSVEIASLSNPEIYWGHWVPIQKVEREVTEVLPSHWKPIQGVEGEVTEGDWTRYEYIIWPASRSALIPLISQL